MAFKVVCSKCNKTFLMSWCPMNEKLCEDCYLKPRPTTGTTTPQMGFDGDPDSGSYGNNVRAMEEDR